jgi:hypothetical protein
MVAEVGSAAHERHHPAFLGSVQDEDDGRRPGASPELAPAVDRMEQTFETGKEVSHRAYL